jgi:XTP/dITP diphosphohydrolase
MAALADDSGLEVHALGGAPGVHSARAVPGSDADRTMWLLSQMEGAEDRRARFVSCIAVVFPDKEPPLVYRGICSGTIASNPRGSGGFGYDPIFIPDGYNATFAELGNQIKTKISHRAMAIKGIAEMLIPVLQYYAVRTMEKSRFVQGQ